MAGCSKKQYAIMMSAGAEGKKLASQMGGMEQEEFNKAFSDLLQSDAATEVATGYKQEEDEDYEEFDAELDEDYDIEMDEEKKYHFEASASGDEPEDYSIEDIKYFTSRNLEGPWTRNNVDNFLKNAGLVNDKDREEVLDQMKDSFEQEPSVVKFNELSEAIENTDYENIENELQYKVQEAFENKEITEEQYNKLFDIIDEKRPTTDDVYRADEDKGPADNIDNPQPEDPADEIAEMGKEMKSPHYGRPETLDEYFERVKGFHDLSDPEAVADWKEFIRIAFGLGRKQVDTYFNAKLDNNLGVKDYLYDIENTDLGDYESKQHNLTKNEQAYINTRKKQFEKYNREHKNAPEYKTGDKVSFDDFEGKIVRKVDPKELTGLDKYLTDAPGGYYEIEYTNIYNQPSKTIKWAGELK